jgi:3-hydroxyacyl-[acyl-carrier-protein] dehydratase
MKFALIDRIVELSRKERIVAVKAVSLAEEYLADHFPTFPVLPGVLMLQGMVEAASWLVRDAQDFARNVILLRQVKSVTYKSFVKPGDLLTLTVSCRKLEAEASEFDGVGHCGDDEVVRARFTLVHRTISGEKDATSPADGELAGKARAALADLTRARR